MVTRLTRSLRSRAFLPAGAFLIACAALLALSATAQTVHVDVSAGKALAFDPDKAMGTSMDILSAKDLETVYSAPMVKAGLSAGWGPIYLPPEYRADLRRMALEPRRQMERRGAQERVFCRQRGAEETLRKSYGYRIMHRGTTRSDSGQDEYSRMTDGDPSTYWKSNPYLSSRFTGDPDSANPQWVVVEFARPQEIDSIRIAWANPYATKYEVEYGLARRARSTSRLAACGWSFPMAMSRREAEEARCNGLRISPSPRGFCASG